MVLFDCACCQQGPNSVLYYESPLCPAYLYILILCACAKISKKIYIITVFVDSYKVDISVFYTIKNKYVLILKEKDQRFYFMYTGNRF